MALWSPCTASGGRQQQLLVSGISLVKRLQEVGQFHQKGQRHLPRHTFKATHADDGAHLLKQENDGKAGHEGELKLVTSTRQTSREINTQEACQHCPAAILRHHGCLSSRLRACVPLVAAGHQPLNEVGCHGMVWRHLIKAAAISKLEQIESGEGTGTSKMLSPELCEIN